mgnify:CR=1 FL=1
MPDYWACREAVWSVEKHGWALPPAHNQCLLTAKAIHVSRLLQLVARERRLDSVSLTPAAGDAVPPPTRPHAHRATVARAVTVLGLTSGGAPPPGGGDEAPATPPTPRSPAFCVGTIGQANSCEGQQADKEISSVHVAHLFAKAPKPTTPDGLGIFWLARPQSTKIQQKTPALGAGA